MSQPSGSEEQGLRQALIVNNQALEGSSVSHPSHPHYQATDNHSNNPHQQQQAAAVPNYGYQYQPPPSAYQHQQQQQQQPPYVLQQPQPQSLYILPHLQYRWNAMKLPPYPQYPTLTSKWLALSRGSTFFLIILFVLYPVIFISSDTRIIGAFLPLIFIPSIIMYRIYCKHYQHVEINLFLNTYIAAATWGALMVLLIELAITVLAAVICIFDQIPAILDALKEQSEGKSTEPGPEENQLLPGTTPTVGYYFFVFFISFFSAGCVEEGLKYYLIKRIRSKTPGYADRYGYLLYACVGALGFSTVENIGYSFSITEPVLDVFLNVLSRICVSTPIHISTAYLIGIGVVRRDVYGENIKLWRILILPILIHGAFDFGLIVASTAIVGNDTLLLGIEIIIVAVIALIMAMTIRIERKKIAGQPPVLPTQATAEAAVYQPEQQMTIQQQQQYQAPLVQQQQPPMTVPYQAPPPRSSSAVDNML